MANLDSPTGTTPPPEYDYPDIDEDMQYPWQGSHAAFPSDVPTSVIDPRLYRDLFPQLSQDAPETVETTGHEDLLDADEYSNEDTYQYPPLPGEVDVGDEDPEFVDSGHENERFAPRTI